ncbi:MAG: hypothetical protein LBV44_01485 [Methylobacillus sp.]|jgi:hypothetical protein|nr:hypothetical protein [Methylobacillus sp.]
MANVEMLGIATLSPTYETARRSGRLAELALALPVLRQTLAEIPRLGCAAQRGRREFKKRCCAFILRQAQDERFFV